MPDARLRDPDRWPLAARIVLGQALQRQERAIEFATKTFLGGCTAGPYVLTGGAANAHARPYQDLASAPDQDETAKLWRTPANGLVEKSTLAHLPTTLTTPPPASRARGKPGFRRRPMPTPHHAFGSRHVTSAG